MKQILPVVLLLFSCCVIAQAQDEGVDQQNDRIRDVGTERAPATNGVKQNTGTGRGVDFGKGRTAQVRPLPNPFRFSARPDAVVKGIQELMPERKLVIDETVSKPNNGLIITQPFIFIKGAVVAESELNRFAILPVTESRGWTRGRYTLVVEIQPIDGLNTNVSVNARIEGRTDGATGGEWVPLQSNGAVEDEFLRALVEKITGISPENGVTGGASSQP